MAARKPRKSKKRPAKTPPAKPFTPPPGMNEAQLAFCLHYLENGFNGTQAYLSAYPGASYETAQANAFKLLRNAQIATYISERRAAILKPLQIDGEEMLSRTALLATVNVADFYDDKGNLLPPHKWPGDLGTLVDSVEVEKGKVKIVGRWQAMRTILEISGKAKSGSLDELTAALEATLARNTKKDSAA